jgi:predicted unusual protein kinase regulating ubiquinone biosynthesis (AarF/ABC1/UbiB family)
VGKSGEDRGLFGLLIPSFFLTHTTILPFQDHLLPAEYVSMMKATMLNAVPPEPFSAVKATVEEELRAPLATHFSSFDPTPVAAASLAQVHRAVTRDGVPVAVKVQHRGLREACAADVATVAALVSAAHAAPARHGVD